MHRKNPLGALLNDTRLEELGVKLPAEQVPGLKLGAAYRRIRVREAHGRETRDEPVTETDGGWCVFSFHTNSSVVT